MTYQEFTILFKAAAKETHFCSVGHNKNKNVRVIIDYHDENTVALVCLELEDHTP